MSRSKYDRQFKVMAVKLANGRGIKITAEELRINENSLRRWIKEYEEYGESAFPGNGNALLCYEYEIKKLEKQVDDLRTENEILKKIPGLLEAKERARFEFIKKNRDLCDVKKACKILKVSRSGFYEYLHRKTSKRQIENSALTEIIKKVFYENKERYGARRIQMVLKRHNIDVNTKRIQKIMRNVGLIAKGAGKRYRKFAKRKYEAKENILNRVFKTDKKNIVWVGDITYIPTRQGFLYLSVFIDIFSRKVTGWSMSKRINQNLVIMDLSYKSRHKI